MRATLLASVMLVIPADAADDYAATAAKRADAAVKAAGPLETAAAERAHAAVAAHYAGLNRIHTDRDDAVKAAAGDKEKAAAARAKAEAAVKVVHDAFLAELAATLTPAQAEAVKDRMVYDVRPNTLKAYCDMLPAMTDAQVARVGELLLAGRDAALVAGSSSEKHETFGRAKGRVVNYLSGQGYDLKAAEKALADKRKAEKK